MAKIGKGLVNKQKANRDNAGFVTPDKVLNIKEHGGDWHKFAKESIHKINILPWQIMSKKDLAYKMKGDFHKDIEDWVYSLNYWVHPRVNDEADILCLKKCFGQSCAICDKAEEKWSVYNDDKTEENKKAATTISAKLRSMYNIEVLTDKLKGQNSFMEASDYIFEDELVQRATECEEGEEPVAFYEIDADEGKIVKFTRPKTARDPSKNFEFRDRSKAISKKLLEGVLKFGELIEVPTPEQVKDFFYGVGYVDEPEETEEELTEEEAYEESEETEVNEEETEPEEEEEKSKTGKWSKCPSQKKFGIEFGEFDACDECPIEVACHKKNKAFNE